MHLYEQIKSHFIIPDAYSDWSNYRNHLTRMIIESTNQVSLPLSFHQGMTDRDLLPTLLILGAGACNDLNLADLSPHFSHITLLDEDSDAMQHALLQYDLTGDSHITCERTSLTGITEQDYMEFCDELSFFLAEHNDDITPMSFCRHAVSLVKQTLSNITYTDILEQSSYDHVCCFGVHSQLLAMYSYIFHAFDVNLRNGLFRNADASVCDNATALYMQTLKEWNDTLIPQINTQILECARQTAWFGLEIKRSTDSSPLTIEGARQAISDLQTRHLAITSHTTVWPFCPEDHLLYDMWIARVNLQA